MLVTAAILAGSLQCSFLPVLLASFFSYLRFSATIPEGKKCVICVSVVYRCTNARYCVCGAFDTSRLLLTCFCSLRVKSCEASGLGAEAALLPASPAILCWFINLLSLPFVLSIAIVAVAAVTVSIAKALASATIVVAAFVVDVDCCYS